MSGQIIPLFPGTGSLDAQRIQGILVSGEDPTEGEALVYNSTLQQYEPESVASGDLEANIASQGIVSALDNGTPWTLGKIASYTTGSGGSAPPIRMIVMGDSLSTGIRVPALAAPQGIIQGAGARVYAGGAAVVTGSSLWFTGRYDNVPAGGSVEYTQGGSPTGDVLGSRIAVYYIAESGAGTFNLEWSSNAGSTWTTAATINAANATQIGVAASYSVSTSNLPRYRVRVNNVTGGPVKIIGWGIFNENGPGVINIPDLFSLGGIDIHLADDVPDAILTPIWAALAPDLVVSCWADAASNWDSGGAFRSFYDRTQSAFGQTDWIQVSRNVHYAFTEAGFLEWQTATSYAEGDYVQSIISNDTYVCTSSHTSGSTTQPGVGASWTTVWARHRDASALAASVTISQTQALAQLRWARSVGQSFFDGNSLFRNFLSAEAKGLTNDVTHLSGKGTFLRNAHLWSSFFLGRLPMGRSAVFGVDSTTQFSGNDTNPAFLLRGSGVPSGNPVFSSNPLIIPGQISIAPSGYASYPSLAVIANDGTNLTFSTPGGPGVTFGVSGTSSLTGWHPGSNNLMLGGRGNFRWRAGLTGIQLGYREVSADATFATDDHVINVTANSPTITLPAATATNSSTGITHNVAAGIAGKVFIIRNTGAGTVTVATTSSQLIDGGAPGTVAAGASLKVMSTGTGWITIP